LFLCFVTHTIETTELEVQLHKFLTSALDGDEWTDSRPNRITLGKETPCTHWIATWFGLEAGMDAVAKRKILASVGN
jgi:hypothetical protein